MKHKYALQLFQIYCELRNARHALATIHLDKNHRCFPPFYDEQTTAVSKKFLSCFQAFWQVNAHAHCPLLAVQQQQQNCCACITFFIVAKTFNLHGMTSIKYPLAFCSFQVIFSETSFSYEINKFAHFLNILIQIIPLVCVRLNCT